MLHSIDPYILLNCSSLGSLQGSLMFYCEFGSPSFLVTAFSWMLSFSTQTLHAALYRSIYSVLTWSSLGTLHESLACNCECGRPSVPVTAVSRMLSVSKQTLHAALFRTIYRLFTWSFFVTLQGSLVCYCECGSLSFPVTIVSWMQSVSTQTLYAALYRSIFILLTWSSLCTLQGFLRALKHSFQLQLPLSCLTVRPSVCRYGEDSGIQIFVA